MPFTLIAKSPDHQVRCCHVMKGYYKVGERCSFTAVYADPERQLAYCGKHYKMIAKQPEDAPPGSRSKKSVGRIDFLRSALQASVEELEDVETEASAAARKAEAASQLAATLAAKAEALRAQVQQLREQVAAQ